MNLDGSYGLGARVLHCQPCGAFRLHDVGRRTDGGLEADCRSCDASTEIQAALGDGVWGVPAGARGPYEVHHWRRIAANIWVRACRPNSLSSAAERVAAQPPFAGHRLCRECARRHPPEHVRKLGGNG